MGLPDFHEIRSGYTTMDFSSDSGVITGATTQIIYTYNGFGEIVYGEVQLSRGSSHVHINDSFLIRLDGIIIYAPAILDLRRQINSIETNIIVVSEYEESESIILKFARSLRFNTQLEILIDKFAVGTELWNINFLYGLY